MRNRFAFLLELLSRQDERGAGGNIPNAPFATRHLLRLIAGFFPGGSGHLMPGHAFQSAHHCRMVFLRSAIGRA